ncbi:MAG: MBL fold metallo-hydrolase [Muribaculaceae bacterium]|nr:MBL fold metallo-hydrolase [Muribaculaceae bacterium]
MKIHIFNFSLFGINTYVVSDPDTRQCAIIDPGMIDREEERVMDDFLKRNNLKVTNIINTHLHIDHAVGDSYLKNKYGVPVSANALDLPLGDRMQQQAAMFGIQGAFDEVVIDSFLNDGDVVNIGNGSLLVIQVPGHSQGSIALYDQKDGFVIVGDALFQGSIGRTDLPGGDFDTLISSIKNGLLSLPDSTVVYPGHGAPTTIGDEKKYNPFL